MVAAFTMGGVIRKRICSPRRGNLLYVTDTPRALANATRERHAGTAANLDLLRDGCCCRRCSVECFWNRGVGTRDQSGPGRDAVRDVSSGSYGGPQARIWPSSVFGEPTGCHFRVHPVAGWAAHPIAAGRSYASARRAAGAADALHRLCGHVCSYWSGGRAIAFSSDTGSAHRANGVATWIFARFPG